MTPLVTVTPRLEQEFRWDFYDQKNGTGPQGNGQNIITYGGPGGARLEFIPAYDWEVIVAAPSWATASGPRGKAEGWADWPAFLVKYRLLSANAENGDYIVTAFFQMSDPLGTPGNISNNVLTAQPTLAFGKGWGDFDIQSTISVQIPVDGIQSANFTAQQNVTRFGDPILWNTAFQYHFAEYFWPELEVNYTYWPNGIHTGLSQVLLTPGIIFGRFKIGQDTPTRPVNLIVGAGYQFAVTATRWSKTTGWPRFGSLSRSAWGYRGGVMKKILLIAAVGFLAFGAVLASAARHGGTCCGQGAANRGSDVRPLDGGLHRGQHWQRAGEH